MHLTVDVRCERGFLRFSENVPNLLSANQVLYLDVQRAVGFSYLVVSLCDLGLVHGSSGWCFAKAGSSGDGSLSPSRHLAVSGINARFLQRR